jgi:hypothetical protein
MKYEIDEKNKCIEIYGCKPSEVRRWLSSFEKVVPGSAPFSEIEDKINNLEKIVTHKQFNLNTIERIYFNKDSINYVTNMSFGNRSFYFSILKRHFQAAKEVFEKDY